MTGPTDAERKQATQAAVALITAAQAGVDVGPLLYDMAAEGVWVDILVASLVGLIGALLMAADEDQPGYARDWLDNVGRNVEAMRS